MSGNLIWVDVETTGFDPDGDYVLEVAVAATDERLQETAARSFVVRPPSGVDLLKVMSAEAIAMHGSSGLLAEVAKGATARDVGTADREIARFLNQVGGATELDGFVMCGSSVHFDRGFFQRHLPLSYLLFSHRVVDVSTLKTLLRLWVPDYPPFEPRRAHRAAADLRESLAELRQYRVKLFLFC